jgi:hypothetical protein
LRLLRVKKRTTVRCSISHFLAWRFAKREALDNGTPYRSIFVNFILLDPLFQNDSRYGLIISPVSTGEKQRARSRTYRSPVPGIPLWTMFPFLENMAAKW